LLRPFFPGLLRDAVDGEGDDVVDEDDTPEDPEDDVNQGHLVKVARDYLELKKVFKKERIVYLNGKE
jgi:hypothetical protein